MAKKTFNDLLKESEVPVLVDFYAEWCGPCKAMSPALSEFAKDASGKLKVIKVDVDKNQGAAQAYNVRGVPTLVLFHKGAIKWRQSGALSKQQLQQSIGPFLN